MEIEKKREPNKRERGREEQIESERVRESPPSLSLHYTTPKWAEIRLLRRTHSINALFREQISATSSQQSA